MVEREREMGEDCAIICSSVKRGKCARRVQKKREVELTAEVEGKNQRS